MSCNGGPFSPWNISNGALKPTAGIGPTIPFTIQTATASAGGCLGQTVVGWQGEHVFRFFPIPHFEYVYRYLKLTLAAIAPPGTGTARAQGRVIDPTPVEIGPLGSSIPLSQSLSAGTQLPRPIPHEPADHGDDDGSTALELIIQGRFGLGTFDDPEMFFPLGDTLPADTFDLFSIRVSQNVAGGVDAHVELHSSPFPQFSVSFDRTASQIAAAIQGAGWIRDSDGSLQLPSDLLLLNAEITNLALSLVGRTAAVGTQVQAEAFVKKGSP